jgi:hypothetical protein
VKDIFVEARAQLAYARMAAGWLDDQVEEYLADLENASALHDGSPADPSVRESRAEFFRSALHPALSAAIVLSVYSLLEQALQRICDAHAKQDRGGAAYLAEAGGSGIILAAGYLERACSPAVAGSGLLQDLNDLRLIRNHLAHQGSDFRSAPRAARTAAEKRGFVDEHGVADPHRILGWMLVLQDTLMDALDTELVREC